MVENRFDITDRIVIITGAGQGIGRSCAHAFAEAGAIPIVAELNGQNAHKVASEIEGKGGKSLAVQTDVGDEISVAAMVTKTLDTFGRIDVLINNTALFSVLPRRGFEDIPLDEWNRVMHVNITGQSIACCGGEVML